MPRPRAIRDRLRIGRPLQMAEFYALIRADARLLFRA